MIAFVEALRHHYLHLILNGYSDLRETLMQAILLCGCKTWMLSRRDVAKLFEGVEGSHGQWRRIRKEEIMDIYGETNIVRMANATVGMIRGDDQGRSGWKQ